MNKFKPLKPYTEFLIVPRASIHDRPKTIESRSEAGHWERDLIICKCTRPSCSSCTTGDARRGSQGKPLPSPAMLAVFGRIDPQKGGVENANCRKRQWTLTPMAATPPRYRPDIRPGNPGDRPHDQPHVRQMPRVQDSIPSLACRAWKGRPNPLLLNPVVLRSRSRLAIDPAKIARHGRIVWSNRATFH